MLKNHLYTIQSVPIKLRIYRLSRFVLGWFFFAAIVNLFLSYKLYTPKSYYINKENKEIISEINSLSADLQDVEFGTKGILFRYSNVYKTVFGMADNINFEKELKYSSDKYKYLHQDRFTSALVKSNMRVDMALQNLSILSEALDTVSEMSKYKDRVLKSLPVMSPINKKQLKSFGDRMGWRFHPIYKRRIFHKGQDLACDRNTPVYAPADGVVKKTGFQSGYGITVEVDHGFGYVTKYAHLNSYKVAVGQSVMRGEEIALSGNTGRTTGPHLHYEILFNGVNVNPINYLSRYMDEETFEKILEGAKHRVQKNYSEIETLSDNFNLIIQ